MKYVILWVICVALAFALAYEVTRAIDKTVEQRLRILDDTTSQPQRVAIIDRLKGDRRER